MDVHKVVGRITQAAPEGLKRELLPLLWSVTVGGCSWRFLEESGVTLCVTPIEVT